MVQQRWAVILVEDRAEREPGGRHSAVPEPQGDPVPDWADLADGYIAQRWPCANRPLIGPTVGTSDADVSNRRRIGRRQAWLNLKGAVRQSRRSGCTGTRI